MDVEKTIEFILASQARWQASFEAGEERAEAYAERAKSEMAEIRQTLQQTAFIQQEQARILVRIEKNVEDLTAAQKDFSAAQKVTDATLKAFIDSLRRGGNGSNGGKQ
jgi:DNA-binding ferritin-like protein (Dps family)